MNETKRLFVSVALPELIHNEAHRLIRKLERQPWFTGRTVSPHKLHCTIVFLGLVDQHHVSTIIERLSSVSFAPIRIELGTLGLFEKRDGSVLFVPVISQELLEFAEVVRSALSDICPQEHRAFTPHITLARFSLPEHEQEVTSFIAQTPVAPVVSEVRRMHLIESKPLGGEYVYSELAKWEAKLE